MFRSFYHYSNIIIQKFGMDCKPVVLISLMLVTFWFMLSYLTSSYFAIFLIFSNFILLFACCVSLSGYALRRYIDARPETSPPVVEVSTISGSTTPYIIPDFPPPYEEAIRIPVGGPYHIINGHPVPECIICATHRNNLLKETIQQSSTTNPSQIANMCSHPEPPPLSSPPSYSSMTDSINSVNSDFSNSSIQRSSSISSSDSITRHRGSISGSCGEPPTAILSEETRQECEINRCLQN